MVTTIYFPDLKAAYVVKVGGEGARGEGE